MLLLNGIFVLRVTIRMLYIRSYGLSKAIGPAFKSTFYIRTNIMDNYYSNNTVPFYNIIIIIFITVVFVVFRARLSGPWRRSRYNGIGGGCGDDNAR